VALAGGCEIGPDGVWLVVALAVGVALEVSTGAGAGARSTTGAGADVTACVAGWTATAGLRNGA
jgi:hypothetical protein